MDTPIKNKSSAPVVIDRQDRWPPPTNRPLYPVRPDFLEEPSNINTGGNKASNVPQEFKASPPLPQRPGIGRGIGRLAGSHPVLFQPGPQNYPKKKLATSMQHQNTNLKSFLLNTVSDFESSTLNSARATTAATCSGIFEQWRSGECRSVEKKMKNTNFQNGSDSDSDGGVTLAVQAAFLQQPGTVGLSLRPVAPKPNIEPQKQEKSLHREHELRQQGLEPEKAVRRPSLRPQPSLSSHIAAILQTPGSVNFMSTRRRSSVTTATAPSPRFSSSASSSTTFTPVELEKNEDKTLDEPSGKHSSPIEALYNLPNSVFTSRELVEDRFPGRFTDPDNDLYWNTPSTQPVQLSKPPQKPLQNPSQNSIQYKHPVPVAITKQRDHRSSSITTPRRFRGLKDGDIVGEEAPEIPKENKGRRMMEKMGYREGTPLGISGDGNLEPVKVEVRVGNRGLGLSKEDLANRAREEQAVRIERARDIEQELLARVAQTERVARMHRASLDAAVQNHAFHQQYQHNPVILGPIDHTAFAQQGQLEEFTIPGPAQIVKYTMATPWEIHKIRERVTQILGNLDACGSLSPVESASVLWSSINCAVADLHQSRFGFLVDAELTEIVRRGYMGIIVQREQTGGGW
ncbi:hypothetical protein P167DRAFT_121689 [Morchella conica CCBAS932]|uniref:G-patch domain-containing protein n=1 Tax=Morchella conica CCBAS932 TaxID=1392247 RepID=A0A3N4L6V9_9PEZI|nr:hypothetical protein P167DRAFT_121689 [Morchella conica CCBAS932]